MFAGVGGMTEGLVLGRPPCQRFTEERNSGMKAPDANGVALIIGAIGTTLGVPIGFKAAGCPHWIVAMALAAPVLLVLTCLRRFVVPTDPRCRRQRRAARSSYGKTARTAP